MSEEGVGIGRRAAEATRWLTRPVKVKPVRESLEGGFWADMEEMGSK